MLQRAVGHRLRGVVPFMLDATVRSTTFRRQVVSQLFRKGLKRRTPVLPRRQDSHPSRWTSLACSCVSTGGIPTPTQSGTLSGPVSLGPEGAQPLTTTSSPRAGTLAVPVRWRLQSGCSMLPHPDKAHRGGEDSYFISSTGVAVGVADGVGGWAEIGVDAGAYARMLMDCAREEVDQDAEKHQRLSPQDVLVRAYYRTNVPGSSTACVLCLNDNLLTAANLGDSGFCIVRDGIVAFQSPQQQHNFNFPFQLGSMDSMSDHPSAAMKFEFPVQEGDVIITGTDGLFDNVFGEEAATIVGHCHLKGLSPESTAQILGKYARMRAADMKYNSPFSYAAIQAGFVYIGGKMDDITVVVSYVTQQPDEEVDDKKEAEGSQLNTQDASLPTSKL